MLYGINGERFKKNKAKALCVFALFLCEIVWFYYRILKILQPVLAFAVVYAFAKEGLSQS